MVINKLQTGWFVIYTRPRHEQKVRDQLYRLGVPVFLPMIKSLRIWADRRKYVDTPLFPSYVFVKHVDLQSYFRSLQMEGIVYYIRSGKEIAKVSETVISNIKILVDHPQQLEVSYDCFRQGTYLTVKEGPFAGFTCEVVNFKGKERILVRILLLKRSLLLNLPVENLFRSPFNKDYTEN